MERNFWTASVVVIARNGVGNLIVEHHALRILAVSVHEARGKAQVVLERLKAMSKHPIEFESIDVWSNQDSVIDDPSINQIISGSHST